jgi:quercetin dioxygenase-like cupin family protein
MMKKKTIGRQGPGALLIVKSVVVAACVLLGTPADATTGYIGGSSTAVRHEHHQQSSDDVKFGPAPSVFPAGAEMAVLQGDPSAAGALFTVRLRFPNGYILPAHWHPTDENVTVISGTFLVGIGDKFDRTALFPALHRGGFITAPANVHHFATVKGRTVVQVHAVGPFRLTYVEPTATANPAS